MKRLKIDELTRLAFVWAEQDRASLANAWPAGSKERAEIENVCEQLKSYRLKRWGRTKLEAVLDGMKPVSLSAAIKKKH